MDSITIDWERDLNPENYDASTEEVSTIGIAK